MAKDYFLFFGTGNPSSNAGLAPTMIVFKDPAGTNITAPGITQVPTNTGIYYFTYGATTNNTFVVDGFTTGLGTARYIMGGISPTDDTGATISAMGVTLAAVGASLSVMGGSMVAIGNTLVAIGATSGGIGSSLAVLIGTTASSFGNTSTDPATLFGYLKRLQEFNEGNAVFNKATFAWDIYSRGSSTQLAAKALADGATTVTKS